MSDTSTTHDASPVYTVQVLTLLHKLWPLLSILLAGVLGGLCALLSPVFGLVAGIIAFIIPPVVTFNRYPTLDTVMLGSDSLHFARNGEVPFSDILSYETDYLMKLKLRSRPLTWYLGGKIGKSEEFETFRDLFSVAMNNWLSAGHAPAQGTPVETRFAGSLRARGMGGALVLMSLGILVIKFSHDIQVAILLPVAIALPLGLTLLFGGNPFAGRK